MSNKIYLFKYCFYFTLGKFYGGWVSQYADANQFLQIDLGKVTKVTRIATQGRGDAGWWSKTYTLECSEDGGIFKIYSDGQVWKKMSILIDTCNINQNVGALDFDSSILNLEKNNLKKSGILKTITFSLPVSCFLFCSVPLLVFVDRYPWVCRSIDNPSEYKQ